MDSSIAGEVSLCDLRSNASARVERLEVQDGLRERLQTLGLIEGTCVQALQKSPSGGLGAYEIRGAVIALRAGDCTDIYVREL